MSQCSTGLSRHERRARAALARKRKLIVHSYDEAAATAGVARRTLERVIALGQGPPSLSCRRAGEAFLHLTFWIGSSVAVAWRLVKREHPPEVMEIPASPAARAASSWRPFGRQLFPIFPEAQPSAPNARREKCAHVLHMRVSDSGKVVSRLQVLRG